MYNVCYIHPSSSDKPNHWVIPAGIFGLIELIKIRGFSVIGLNYPMELNLDANFSLTNWLKCNLSSYYLVDIHWFVHTKGANDVINLIKEVDDNAVVIVGGITATLFPELLLKLIPNIDYIVLGDAEEPLLDLINSLENKISVDGVKNIAYKRDNIFYMSNKIYKLCDFSNIKYNSFDFLNNAKDYLKYSCPGILTVEKCFWIVNGRGCLYSCPGCGGANYVKDSLYNRRGLIKRDISMLIDDIYSLNKVELDVVKLTHDICSFGIDYYEEFFIKYNEFNINMSIYNECWQLPSNKFIKTALKRGLEGKLRLVITVHTGDEELRENLGKFYTNKELIEILNECIAARFTVDLFFSRFLPKESYTSLKSTLILINEIKKMDETKSLINIYYEPYLADPLSKISFDDIPNYEDIFNRYINWNNNSKETLYSNMLSSLSLKCKIIDKKILNII